MFPVREGRPRPERFRNKEPMVVVQAGDEWKAYALRDVAAAPGDKGAIEDVVGGKRLRLTYSDESNTVRAELLGEEYSDVPVAYLFWFALSAMLPDVEVYQPPVRPSGAVPQQESNRKTPRSELP
jgi:hypothetical protein